MFFEENQAGLLLTDQVKKVSRKADKEQSRKENHLAPLLPDNFA